MGLVMGGFWHKSKPMHAPKFKGHAQALGL